MVLERIKMDIRMLAWPDPETIAWPDPETEKAEFF
jgi:hypothetical protein